MNRSISLLLALICAAPSVALDVNVRNSPYSAAGNASTNDRAAIQQAIDDVNAAGGGTVLLPSGFTFLSGTVELKNNVTLEINGTLQQSNTESHFPYSTSKGKTHCGSYNWCDWYFFNYPLVYGRGTDNTTITGAGEIRLAWGGSDGNTIFCAGIGLFKVTNFEISNLTLTNSGAYYVSLHQCSNGLVSGVSAIDPNGSVYNSDGFSLEGCQHIRVTGCAAAGKDDACYIWSSYRDARHGENGQHGTGGWWDSDDPQASYDIEIDNNNFDPVNATKSFNFFPWGNESPDLSKTEIRDVYVHDNYFGTGGWSYCIQLWDQIGDRGCVPMCNIRMENNTYVDRVEFQDGPVITDAIYDFSSWDGTFVRPATFQNPGFETDGACYWTWKRNSNETSAGARNNSAGQTGVWYGYIDNLDQGDAKIYQGLRLPADTYGFRADVQSSGATVRMFVRDANDNLVAGQEFNNTAWQARTLNFTASSTGLYRLGVERGNATSGWARIDEASIGAPSATGLNASFTATPQSGEAPLEVSFDASGSSDDGSIVSYEWDFGDGQTGNGVTTTHTYGSSGSYTALLTITDNDANSASASKTISAAACEPGWIFTDQAPNSFDNDGRYELGTRFEALCPGSITTVRIYAGAQEGGDHTVRIWRASDQSVVTGPHTMNFSSGQAGWKEYLLPSPLAIDASTEYVVSVSNSSDNYYASGINGFSSGITNGSLITYVGSGVYSTSLGSMPTQTYENANYFRDIRFEPSTTARQPSRQHLLGGYAVRITPDFVASSAPDSYKMIVTDLRGKIVRRRSWDGAREVPVWDLAAGAYAVSVTSDHGRVSSTIVKNQHRQ